MKRNHVVLCLSLLHVVLSLIGIICFFILYFLSESFDEFLLFNEFVKSLSSPYSTINFNAFT
jgi:hypothetical protein